MSPVLKQPPALLIPWAEAVPGYGPVTVDLLLTLPDDGYRYESSRRGSCSSGR